MIEHVVLMETPASALDRRGEIAGLFRGFALSIPGIVSVAAGPDFSGRCLPYTDMAVLRFESRSALDAYQTHPEHQKLIALLNEIGCTRIVADIEA